VLSALFNKFQTAAQSAVSLLDRTVNRHHQEEIYNSLTRQSLECVAQIASAYPEMLTDFRCGKDEPGQRIFKALDPLGQSQHRGRLQSRH
jgi:hypothetical protein